MKRVTHYERTTINHETGKTHVGIYPFTQEQVNAVAAVVEDDGIPLLAALKLCDLWECQAKLCPTIEYFYRVVEEKK